MMRPAEITPDYSNRITTQQNHNPPNIHWPTMNPPTYPFSPPAIPPQIQATQWQLPPNYYTTPVQQQMQRPSMNYINNEDRGQHIQKNDLIQRRRGRRNTEK
ncbi:hypothetical protein B7P43_G14710 [Cryptotermes secundus]|uniref:Uncharacterized protein n=1 Tax=Cryptotermes secundus TaxID=105785 RepID=A0A2J7QKA9_9NEOP|nr:hypothetical protein B7P43_G14710 [Cryptotermes secundus]